MANCKYCQAELPEGTTVCPACGKDNTDAKKKMPPGKIALIVAAVVVLAALVVALVYAGMNVTVTSKEKTEATAESVAETEAATIPADGNPDDETAKGTYTASDAEVVAAKDTVVARVGDKTLTNGQLQMFYWTEVRNFLSSYGAYASMLGLDVTKPLDVQTCGMADTPCTWQQFFLASALNSWRNYQATAAEAEKSGYELDADMREQLDSSVANLEMTAELYGYESAEALLLSDVGPGAGIEDYQHFLNLYYTGSMYFSDLCEKDEPSEQEVEDYFTANEEAYASSGLTRENKTVDVRHVLIMPEGATSENIRSETFEESAWESSRVKAEELLAQFEQGDKSEESFSELAKAHSQDGSAENGGLYAGVQEGQMVEAFNDWCFDDIRQPGDYGLVKTEFGYHLMFFVDSQPIWKESAKSDLISARANEKLAAILEAYPMEAEFDKILLGFVDLNQGAEEPTVQEQPAEAPAEADERVWIIAGVCALALAVAAYVYQKKEEEL